MERSEGRGGEAERGWMDGGVERRRGEAESELRNVKQFILSR